MPAFLTLVQLQDDYPTPPTNSRIFHLRLFCRTDKGLSRPPPRTLCQRGGEEGRTVFLFAPSPPPPYLGGRPEM